jgi:hypothetical protein
MNYEQVAQIAHETNRAFCLTIGDRSQPEWAEAPDWQKTSAINGVAFHVGNLSNGIEPSPSASHEAWLAEKTRDGWKFGPVKNPQTKEHPCFVPYEQLPIEQRQKDYLFAAIVKAFYDAEQRESKAA